MEWLSAINPFRKTIEQAGETIDKLVLDKDLAEQLKADIRLVELEGERMSIKLEQKRLELASALNMSREESHRIALQTKTSPKVDAFHKLSRTFLAALSMLLSFIAVMVYAWQEKDINANVMAILGFSNAAAGTYIYAKGKGAPIAGEQPTYGLPDFQVNNKNFGV